MQAPEVIEVNEDPPSFNEDEWIGKGRKYPKAEDAPLALIYYIDGLLAILILPYDPLNPKKNRKPSSACHMWRLAKKNMPYPASG